MKQSNSLLFFNHIIRFGRVCKTGRTIARFIRITYHTHRGNILFVIRVRSKILLDYNIKFDLTLILKELLWIMFWMNLPTIGVIMSNPLTISTSRPFSPSFLIVVDFFPFKLLFPLTSLEYFFSEYLNGFFENFYWEFFAPKSIWMDCTHTSSKSVGLHIINVCHKKECKLPIYFNKVSNMSNGTLSANAFFLNSCVNSCTLYPLPCLKSFQSITAYCIYPKGQNFFLRDLINLDHEEIILPFCFKSDWFWISHQIKVVHTILSVSNWIFADSPTTFWILQYTSSWFIQLCNFLGFISPSYIDN